MKKIVRAVIAIGVGTGGVFAGIYGSAQLLGSPEPRYQGRTFDSWNRRLTNQDPAISTPAQGVLHDIILPQLTNQIFMDTNDSRLRLWLVEQLDQLPGIQVDFSAADTRRVQAIEQLAALGTRARPATPVLLAVLQSQEEFLLGAAANALVKIDADAVTAVPALIASLATPDGRGRPEVIDALAEYGPQARAAVPALAKLLGDRSSKEIIVSVPKALKAIDPAAAAKLGVP